MQITDEMVEVAAEAVKREYETVLSKMGVKGAKHIAPSNHRYVRAALRAALAQAPQEQGVGVKALEWEEAIHGGWYALGTGGVYHVHVGIEDGKSYYFYEPPIRHEPPMLFDTADDAKAAAQADYEARILAALSSPAQGQKEGDDYFDLLVAKAKTSATKASKKFPQPNYVTLKIAEEAGEVVRGAVHYAEGRMEWSEVEGEIVQLLAMLMRFVTEGDQVNGIVPPITSHKEGDNG